MGRAPCCEKMGLKKGPWTRDEDQILINYITLYGHGNWRALPKLAGLLRCGKSCRLRWTNYLRPDIKRGNFSREEEETIIQLHQALGNRWSAIAARLPGRTDNEIKNVWHTHLKKRLNKQMQTTPEGNKSSSTEFEQKIAEEEEEEEEEEESKPEKNNISTSETSSYQTNSPQQSICSDISSEQITTPDNDNLYEDVVFQNLPQMDEEFWSEVFSGEINTGETSDVPATQLQFQSSLVYGSESYHSNLQEDHMDFWYDIFTRAGDLPELPNF